MIRIMLLREFYQDCWVIENRVQLHHGQKTRHRHPKLEQTPKRTSHHESVWANGCSGCRVHWEEVALLDQFHLQLGKSHVGTHQQLLNKMLTLAQVQNKWGRAEPGKHFQPTKAVTISGNATPHATSSQQHHASPLEHPVASTQRVRTE